MQSLTIVDPVIELGIGTGGTALVVDDGYDRGVLMDYYHNPAYNGETAGFNHAFMGYDNSTGRLIYVTNVAPGELNVSNEITLYQGIIYGGATFGNIWLGNAQSISTDTTSGGVVSLGGIGTDGNINVGGQLSNFTGNINIFGSNTATSSTTGALTVAGGAGIIGNLFVGGNLVVNNSAQFSYVMASNAITAASLFSNATIQASSDLFANTVTSNTTIQAGTSLLANTITSNTTIQANSTITGSQIDSNGAVNGASLNIRGFANVQVLQSNGYVSGNTWVIDGNAHTSTSTFQQVVDAWPAATFRTAHYMVQVTDTTNSYYQATQVMLIHDGTDVYLTEYGDIYTNQSLGQFAADIVSNMVELLFTPKTSATMIIKSVRTAIDT